MELGFSQRGNPREAEIFPMKERFGLENQPNLEEANARLQSDTK